jgi:hypothetical protein
MGYTLQASLPRSNSQFEAPNPNQTGCGISNTAFAVLGARFASQSPQRALRGPKMLEGAEVCFGLGVPVNLFFYNFALFLP